MLLNAVRSSKVSENLAKSANNHHSLNSDNATKNFSGANSKQLEFEREMMSQREPNELNTMGPGKQSFKLFRNLSF